MHGNPTGYCGYHRRGDCHEVGSEWIVEKLCLNKTSCMLYQQEQTTGEMPAEDSHDGYQLLFSVIAMTWI